jgi:hypothetical protein
MVYMFFKLTSIQFCFESAPVLTYLGKYNSYTEELKMKVIKFAEKSGNCSAERKFFVNESTHTLLA